MNYFLSFLTLTACCWHISSLFCVSVSDEEDLFNATAAANGGGDSTLNIQQSFSYQGNLYPFNSTPSFGESNTSITVNGGGETITSSTMAGLRRGFFVRSGSLDINNLTIQGATAKGGDGGFGFFGGAGGGAGLGGGLFVVSGATVTLNNVTFDTCTAQGGSGGNAGGVASAGGGGGGMGGNGGNASGGDDQGGGVYGNGADGNGGGGGGSSTDANGQTGGLDFSDAASGGAGNTNGNGADGNDGGGGGGSANQAGGNAGGINGGFGGGGGGGSGDVSAGQTRPGGAGSFGGGGGGSSSIGGKGGFGGGGGSGTSGAQGGGFGGGNGSSGMAAGGGGAGMGGAIFIQDGGTLKVTGGGVTLANSVTMGGSGHQTGQTYGTDIFLMSGGTIDFENLMNMQTLTNPIESDQGAGGGTGGGVNVTSAALTLSGANTYTGLTTVGNGGELAFASGGSIITDVTVDAGGMLTLAESGAVSGAVALDGTLTAGANLTLANTITFGGSAAVIDSGSGEVILTGELKGTTFAKVGMGALNLTGATASYTGALDIQGGTVVIGPLNQITNGVTFSGSGGTLDLTQGGTFSGAGQLTAAGVMDTGANEVTWSGAISGGAALTKKGEGSLTLNGDTSGYTGALAIDGGTLVLSVSAASSAVTVAGGTQLTLAGGTVSSASVSANALLVVTANGGTIAGDLNGAGTLNLGGTLSLGSGTFSGDLSGSGGVTKTGMGTFTLGGSALYTGTTAINGGIFSVTGTMTPQSPVTVASDGTFQLGVDAVLLSLSGEGTVDLGGNQLTVSSGNFSGDIQGMGGSIVKTGSGTLTLSGSASDYTGGTIISKGVVVFGAASSLGEGVATLNGGTLQAGANGLAMMIDLAVNSGGILSTGANALTWAGAFSGSGALEKTGTGTLTVQDTMGYLGPLTLSEGEMTLSGAGASLANISVVTMASGSTLNLGAEDRVLQTLMGAGTIQVENLQTVAIMGGTFSGSIAGEGGLIKTGSGLLTLTGTNSYSGGTQVNMGTLAVSGQQSLGSGLFTLNGGTLQANGALFLAEGLQADGGVIDVQGEGVLVRMGMAGAGAVQKTGPGTLFFEGSHTYSGALTVNQGAVRVEFDAELPATIVLNTGGRLSGFGTVQSITNQGGEVFPGLLEGELTVTGSYLQQAGKLLIEIGRLAQSSRLSVGTTATLGGTLEWSARPGTYREGEEFTPLTAGNPITTEFATVNNPYPQFFSLEYRNNAVVIIVTGGGGNVTPVPISDLAGNPRRVGDYLFGCGSLPPNEDLIDVMNNLDQLAPGDFIITLPKLSPVQMRALPLTARRNDTQIATLAYDRTLDCVDNQDNFWIAPVYFYYDQGERASYDNQNRLLKREIGFRVDTKGVSVGQLWKWNQLYFGAHADYTYSSLTWREGAGKARIHAVYLAPVVGYAKDFWHVDASVQGTRSFYDVDRRLRFSAIKRTAHNDHKSWNVLVRLAGGTRFELPQVASDFFISTEGALHYLNVWESGYTESGADSINLVVSSEHWASLNPKVDFRFIKVFPYSQGQCEVSFNAGWQSFIALSNTRYRPVRFFNQQVCKSSFFVEGLVATVHEAVLGARITFLHCDHVSAEIDYEASLGQQTTNHQAAVSFFWKW